MANVLFVCLHNAGRSQMSRALFERAAGGRLGLNLVQTLSECWGVEHAAERGTRAWAFLPRAPATVHDESSSVRLAPEL